MQVWTCTPTASGTLAVAISPTGTANVTAVTPLVPEPRVTMKTSQGDFVIELNPTKAPLSVKNFMQYVNDGFYNDKIFHRVLSDFMIQGGGYNANLVQGTTRAPIALESANGLHNTRGTIAMARTNVRDSATSEFFINVVDNASLDIPTNPDGYAVFGKVVSGMETVDKIRYVPVHFATGGGDNKPSMPNTTVQITSVLQTQ